MQETKTMGKNEELLNNLELAIGSPVQLHMARHAIVKQIRSVSLRDLDALNNISQVLKQLHELDSDLMEESRPAKRLGFTLARIRKYLLLRMAGETVQ